MYFVESTGEAGFLIGQEGDFVSADWWVKFQPSSDSACLARS